MFLHLWVGHSYPMEEGKFDSNAINPLSINHGQLQRNPAREGFLKEPLAGHYIYFQSESPTSIHSIDPGNP